MSYMIYKKLLQKLFMSFWINSLEIVIIKYNL